MFRTPSLRDSIPVALRKLLQGGRRESQAMYICNEGSRQSPWSKIRYQVKDAEAETPVFWSSDANSWLIGKVPDVGKDREQKEKRVSEVEMAGWHASLMQWTWTWVNFEWITVLGALIHIGRPKIAGSCDISCLLIWQEIFSFHTGHRPDCTVSFCSCFSFLPYPQLLHTHYKGRSFLECVVSSVRGQALLRSILPGLWPQMVKSLVATCWQELGGVEKAVSWKVKVNSRQEVNWRYAGMGQGQGRRQEPAVIVMKKTFR